MLKFSIALPFFLLQFCNVSNQTSINGFIPLAQLGDSASTSSSTGTYSISGTVSSLSGTLILSLNNSESLTLTQDGSFQFSTFLASGTTYSVSVTTQPNGMYCSISNGSGTISSNITNVGINCSLGNSNGTLVGGTIFNELTLTGNVTTVSSGGSLTGINGITTDGSNIYLTSWDRHTILKVVISGGSVSVIGGSDGSNGTSDGNATSTARFNNPSDLVYLNSNLYIADFSNGSIRKLDLSTNIVSTLATGLSYPYGITSDGTDLYITDKGRVAKLQLSDNSVSTFVGSTSATGFQDGFGNSARFKPSGNYAGTITFDGTNLYVADRANCAIRKVEISSKIVSTPYGNAAGSSPTCSVVDANGNLARFKYPDGITSDGTNLYLGDSSSNVVRKITVSTGDVTTVAGSTGNSGFVDGLSTTARFNQSSLVTSDGKYIYVTDYGNNAVRRIE
ncbi:MAG: hypothetical protein KDK36_13880 [Leptospiraceae bacterium]|nr:hypothetical protein [Leptospiraceae bacterium]